MSEASELPDFVLDPNAVLKDTEASWRHGAPPSYAKTREFYEKSESTNAEQPGHR